VPRDDGSSQRIWRCADCQVALYSSYGSDALRFVRAGTLDDRGPVEPDVHIYTRSKRPWVVLPEAVPSFEGFYDPRTFWTAEVRARYEAERRRR
jgi:hypothetical protein